MRTSLQSSAPLLQTTTASVANAVSKPASGVGFWGTRKTAHGFVRSRTKGSTTRLPANNHTISNRQHAERAITNDRDIELCVNLSPWCIRDPSVGVILDTEVTGAVSEDGRNDPARTCTQPRRIRSAPSSLPVPYSPLESSPTRPRKSSHPLTGASRIQPRAGTRPSS